MKANPNGPRARRLVVLSLLTLGATALGGIGYANFAKSKAAPKASDHITAAELRVISLSPGITETVIALGAKKSIVGVSDYCDTSALPREIRRVGTAITPDYEKIMETAPSTIIASQVGGEQLTPLQKIAPTTSLPWLTLDEWQTSIIKLGSLIDRVPEAHALSEKIQTSLAPPPQRNGLRILFALDYGDSGSNEIWFIRNNSIHGALLVAAGATNAVEKDIAGQAKLSPEALLALDPDGIIVLLPQKDDRNPELALARYKKWAPLGAVKNNQVAVLTDPGALTIGPSVLNLIPRLRAIITKMEETHAKQPPEETKK